MKSIRFILAAVSIAVAGCLRLWGCGPYYNEIPRPCYFASSSRPETIRDAQIRQNLLLWQQQTSPRIPLADIRQAVYTDDSRTFGKRSNSRTEDNAFYTFIRNAGDSEAINFLLTAKELEEARQEMNSPWYYPKERNGESPDVFGDIMARCRAYKGRRFADRYALQMVRASFAAGRYQDCIDIFSERLDSLPDDNLMKRMALGYVAGCWSRLGDTERANDYFATVGDISSIVHEDPIAYLTGRNPDSPMLLSHLQSIAAEGDTARVTALLPVADAVLADSVTAYRGDWEFLSAYIANDYLGDREAARASIDRAMASDFSSEDFADHARAYRMMLDAVEGNTGTLLEDLQWIKDKVDILSPTKAEWKDMLQNIVFAHWLPGLMEREDHATAVLLCGFADNLSAQSTLHFQDGYDHNGKEIAYITYDQMRHDPAAHNTVDYSSLTFELMQSLKSTQLAKVYKKIVAAKDPLSRFLKNYARIDPDYIFELTGTLCLREERYADAVNYLSRVSPDYFGRMNIAPYLRRDPMYCYPPRHKEIKHDSWTENIERSVSSNKTLTADPGSAKLEFAKTMADLRHKIIKSSADPDTCGLAMIDYAIAWRNSFEECWALTQYWRGENVPGRNYASVESDRPLEQYPFIYEYDNSKKVEERFRHMTRQALSILRTDEAKAKAHYRLGNLRSVIKRYGDTETAALVRSSCDKWRDWL